MEAETRFAGTADHGYMAMEDEMLGYKAVFQ